MRRGRSPPNCAPTPRLRDAVIAVVLAAGLGTRMKSATPKVLHRVCGKPMLRWVVDAARGAGAKRVIVVVSTQGETVRAAFPDCEIALQKRQRGTGDALRAAAPLLRGGQAPVLVLYGDTPLLRAETLRRLARARGRHPLAIVTFRPPVASGYGRVVREDGRVVRIVEEKDATSAERRIEEANAGMVVANAAFLARALGRLRPSKRTGELYLTDLVAMASHAGGAASVEVDDPLQVLGVNHRADLAVAAGAMRGRIVEAHMRAGVTFEAPARAAVDSAVRIGADTTIGAGVELRGATVVGAGCRIDAGCILTDARVDDGATILPYSVITESVVGAGARIGPFAHLRPGSEIGAGAHVGNFVETKKTRLGEGAKANHLAYLGDTEVGARANIGAGTITCNYDGFAKHRTVIEEGAFIGSNTELVAPVRVGAGAYVGAGSTITRDVPPGALALTRAPLRTIDGYAARLRKQRGG